MNKEEKDLKQFKEEFIGGYIDPYFNRLLDLRNAIKDANGFDEIHGLMKKEKEFLQKEFNLIPEKKDESKETNMS